MKTNTDYSNDLADIRSMMERSTKFLSLSGWAGICAGVYALLGALFVYHQLGFNPTQLSYTEAALPFNSATVIYTAIVVLLLAVSTAAYLSFRKAGKNGEKAWNPTSRRMLLATSVPLLAGGVLILIFAHHGLFGLLAPLTMIFYGIALYNGSHFTYHDIRYLGLAQLVLGLMGCLLISWGLLLWAFGFGFLHIGYGFYMYLRYER